MKKGPHKGKFKARLCTKNKTIFLGYFNCAEDAGAAYFSAAKQYYGKFAHA